jgi:hypothetical protein
MRQHPRHRVVDGAAEAAALRRNVDEWDRPLVQAGVLIHDEILRWRVISENRHPLFGIMRFGWRVIFSEIRHPLLGIMR